MLKEMYQSAQKRKSKIYSEVILKKRNETNFYVILYKTNKYNFLLNIISQYIN